VRLLPYERLTLRSDDSPEVVRARLATLVTAKWFYLKRPPEPFRGSIQGRHFKVVRVLGSSVGKRNSWQPVIIGDIAPAPSGTEIRCRMRLPLPVAAFMVFWFGSLLWGAAKMFLAGQREGVLWFGFGAMLLGGYAAMSLSFWPEVNKARAALCDGLGCRVVEQTNRLVR
jgi:hypothetical protein